MFKQMASYLSKMVNAKALTIDKESEVGSFEVYLVNQNKDLMFGWIYYSEMNEIEEEKIADNKKLSIMANIVMGRLQNANHKKNEWLENYAEKNPDKERVAEISKLLGRCK